METMANAGKQPNLKKIVLLGTGRLKDRFLKEIFLNR